MFPTQDIGLLQGRNTIKNNKERSCRDGAADAVRFRLLQFSNGLKVRLTPAYKPMSFFTSAVEVLQTLVIALGAGLGIWGAINLMEGYGNDNPGAKSQGMKQLMAGGGVALIGITLVPLLSGLFT